MSFDVQAKGLEKRKEKKRKRREKEEKKKRKRREKEEKKKRKRETFIISSDFCTSGHLTIVSSTFSRVTVFNNSDVVGREMSPTELTQATISIPYCSFNHFSAIAPAATLPAFFFFFFFFSSFFSFFFSSFFLFFFFFFFSFFFLNLILNLNSW